MKVQLSTRPSSGTKAGEQRASGGKTEGPAGDVGQSRMGLNMGPTASYTRQKQKIGVKQPKRTEINMG